MATWKKSPPDLIAAFDIALARQPLAERRQMFGYPCAFVNGHLAIGLHEDRVIARVPDEAERLPCVMLGRRMKDYAAIDFDSAMAPGAMQSWMTRAVAFTGALPPKPPKPAKPAKGAKVEKALKAAKVIKSAPAVKRTTPKR